MLNIKEIKNRHFYYSDLYYDFIFNFKKLRHNYFYDYRSIDHFKKRSSDIASDYDNKIRVNVAEILKDINLRYGCSSKTLGNIESLKKSDTLAVVGGQQPGFLSGPLFIIYKLISVIKLCLFISDSLNMDAVPVFWVASDDSNFSQVSSTYLQGPGGKIEKTAISLEEAGLSPRGKRYSDIYLDEGLLTGKIREILEILPVTDFTPGIEKFLKNALSSLEETGSGIRLTDFFSAIITKLFSKYGLVIIDPSDARLKKMALKTAYFDIENHGILEEEINRSGSRLENEGYHRQLPAGRDAMNFYIVKDGIRNKVRKVNKNAFDFGGMRMDKKELTAFLDMNPSTLSLNVALRPIFQDTILPVLATVCGPGETAYLAQLKTVYEAAGKKTGIIYPRLSATIIEKKLEKSFKRAQIEFRELTTDKKAMLEISAGRVLFPDIGTLLEEFENDMLSRLEALKETLKNSTGKNGIYAGSSFDRIENNIKKETAVLKKKIIAEAKHKGDDISGDIDKLSANILPDNKLQERVFNIFSYINKYDFRFMDNIFDLLDVRSNSHKFVFFDGKG